MGDLYYWSTPQWVTLFHLFFQILCISYQPNLWLSGLEHLDSYREVSGLSTRLNFDIFSFKFSDILFVFNFQQRVAKLGAFPINLIIFKAPLVQFWISFLPSSHCANRGMEIKFSETKTNWLTNRTAATTLQCLPRMNHSMAWNVNERIISWK